MRIHYFQYVFIVFYRAFLSEWQKLLYWWLSDTIKNIFQSNWKNQTTMSRLRAHLPIYMVYFHWIEVLPLFSTWAILWDYSIHFGKIHFTVKRCALAVSVFACRCVYHFPSKYIALWLVCVCVFFDVPFHHFFVRIVIGNNIDDNKKLFGPSTVLHNIFTSGTDISSHIHIPLFIDCSWHVKLLFSI